MARRGTYIQTISNHVKTFETCKSRFYILEFFQSIILHQIIIGKPREVRRNYRYLICLSTSQIFSVKNINNIFISQNLGKNINNFLIVEKIRVLYI